MSASVLSRSFIRKFFKSDSVCNPIGRRNLAKSSLSGHLCDCNDSENLSPCNKSTRCKYRVEGVPVYIRVYGCQMNVNDTSIVKSVLKDYGYKLVDDDSEAEIQLLMTCAIRDSAESKIWEKLKLLRHFKNDPGHPLKQVGILGCMAERLKDRIVEENDVADVVAGPDTYRDLPRLFFHNRSTAHKAINCQYLFDETYSDIRPETDKNSVKAFVSITRGCDNMCSFCIVPYTRGKERSRSIVSIIDEVKALMTRGIKEVTLLGQNVNSYRDVSTPPDTIGRSDLVDQVAMKEQVAAGFKTVYRPRKKGLTFDVLLEEVANVSPELRVRFTSPHPKDFTEDVIDVMSRYPNISKCIHLPAQSGSNTVLSRMRRGYTREAYLELVNRLRHKMPDLAITTDIITGFCGETADEHQDTIDLINKVGYTYIFMFKYSMREKTHAYHNFKDNVDESVKQERLLQIYQLFRDQATRINKSKIGSEQLVLIESDSKRSETDWQGLSDTNITTIIPKSEVVNLNEDMITPIKPGDYVACRVVEANSQTFRAIPIHITSQERYYSDRFSDLKMKESN